MPTHPVNSDGHSTGGSGSAGVDIDYNAARVLYDSGGGGATCVLVASTIGATGRDGIGANCDIAEAKSSGTVGCRRHNDCARGIDQADRGRT